eukprot:gene26254-17355_t
MKFQTVLCIATLLACTSVTEGTKKESPPPVKKSPPPPGTSPSPSVPDSPPAPVVYTDSPYAYEIQFRADGLAPNKDGFAEYAQIDNPETAVQFMKDYVVNGGRAGGSDPQVALFRLQAFDFFNTRFGVEIPEGLFNMPAASRIEVGEDSYVLPVMIGRDSAMTAPLFRNRNEIRYLPNAPVYDAGFYLFVGPAGLPAGGTYNKELFSGARIGFGTIVVDRVCPDLNYVSTVCRGVGHAEGWLAYTYQTENPQYMLLQKQWHNAGGFNHGAPSAAMMYPIQLTLLDGTLGTGSCSGLYYALVVNDDWFKLVTSMTCTFTARLSWESYHPEDSLL